jgi:hypothetical protein
VRRKQITIAMLVVVLFSSYAVSIVHAQSASIQMQNLSYPTQRVTNLTAPVTFDITFSGVHKGDILFAEIEDLEYRRFAVGTVSATSEACIPLPEKYSTTPLCGWRLNATSGSEHIVFQLTISTHARIYNLGATIGLYSNSTGQVISNSISTQRFIIKGGTILTLKVTVLDNVSVTIDGKQQPPGSISINLAPGVHAISVPNMTSLDDSTRLVFGGWSDASTQLNRTDNLEIDTVLAAEYIKEYKLTLISPVNATGADWYYEGSNVQISVSPQLSPGLLGTLGAKTHFEGWFENNQLKTTSNTATLQMNSPRTWTAEWTTDYTIPITITIAAFAAIVVMLLALRRRKHRPSSEI